MRNLSLTTDAPATAAHPDPSDFTTVIDNPFLTLTPGTTFVYEDKDEHTIDYVVVTDKTKVLDGVTCVQVHDYELIDGQLSEDTLDWYAQDSAGNVWYFGENSHQYEPGNPDPIGHEGSWKAGVDGATAGIIMEANPQVGDRYGEEHAEGVAEDKAKVLSLTDSQDVLYGSFDNLLQTKNFTPLEPDVLEHKWYAAGIGSVLTTDNEGAFEELVQIKIDGKETDDTLTGFFGLDTLSGHGGDDTLSGLGGEDLLYGGAANDQAFGGKRGDLIDGGAGDDTVFGGGGNDGLTGGMGDDVSTGGGGADAFVFLENDASAVDTIADYSFGDGDVIVVAGGEAGVAYDAHVDHVWQLTLNDGHVIVLQGVHDTDHDGHILNNVAIVDAWG